MTTSKRIIVVLGMHRSGTSAITRGLNVLGVDLGERLMPSAEGVNAKGFFEDLDVYALNVEILQAIGSDWDCLAPIEPRDVETLHRQGYFLRAVDLLRQKTNNIPIFGFKDPRVTKLLPFWQSVFIHCGFDTGYVLAIRNPLSVALSLAKRNGFSHEKSYMLWLGHTLTVIAHTQAYPRVLVDYDLLLEAPQTTIALIANQLDLAINTQSSQTYQTEFLEQELRHNFYTVNDLRHDEACPPLALEIYTHLLDAARDGTEIKKPEFHTRTTAWINEYDRLKSSLRLADQLAEQIFHLNQSIARRDGETTSIIKSALQQDQNIFQSAFDTEWYVNKYPDIDPAVVDPYQHYIHYGVIEGRTPTADRLQFIRHGLLERLQNLNALNSDHSEREQAHLAQLTQARQQIETQLIQLAEREKAFSEQLQEIQQAHEQQKSVLNREHAEREQALNEQLTQARQQIETQLIQLAEREKAFSEQLQEIQQAHEQQKSVQNREHAEREQAHLAQLTQARQQTETQLIQLAEREKAFSEQLQEMQQAHERQKDARNRELVEREQALNEQLTQTRQQTETQLIQLAEREKAFSEQLQEIQQAHERQKDALNRERAEREQTLNTRLAKEQAALYHEGLRWMEKEKGYSQTIAELQHAMSTMRGTYSWRWTAPLRALAAVFGQKSLSAPLAARLEKNEISTSEQANDRHAQPEDSSALFASLSNSNDGEIVVPQNLTNPTAPSLDELLSYYDEKFIHSAYHTVLGRAPDPEGMRYYLARIRAGISKVEILAQLRTSIEGKSRNHNVNGLDNVIRRYKLMKIPLIGTLYKIAGFENANSLERLIRSVENKIHVMDSKLISEFAEIKTLIINQYAKSIEQNINTVDQSEVIEINKSLLKFDPQWYLEEYPDVAISGMDPLEHYMQFGQYEWRHPFFDGEWYLSQYLDVADSGMDALQHYREHGKFEGRHCRFDKNWYLARYPDVASSGIDPLTHYLEHGKSEGRFPAFSDLNKDQNNYEKWVVDFDTISDKSISIMQSRILDFKKNPIISIVMPVYNPNPIWLVEAIESVRNQIYSNWEFCITDDASPDPAIRPILERYTEIDPRIKVHFRTKNGHISTASNDALALTKGSWIALLDHDDLLPAHALFWVVDAINNNPDACMIYSDEDKINEKGARFSPYFKCDWNQDLFYSHNMFSHLGVYKAELVHKVGGFRVGMEGSQDYDLALRCMELIEPEQIHHIPRVLYHWRVHAESTASSSDAKPYAMIAGERAINEHFIRSGINAKAELISFGYRVRYSLPDNLPLVSLIIPTRNGFELLKQCIDSILTKTTYSNFEIIIVDNGSDDSVTLQYLNALAANERIRIVRDDGPFNYSALNNKAVKLACGEIIGLINNDIEVISPDWLSEMVSHALRPGVGAVGAKLLYPNGAIQHAGVVYGVAGIAAHVHRNLDGKAHGYFSRANLIQSFSIVTAACLVIRKEVYEAVDGLNEIDLKVAFNDVDFCLRLNKAGYRNIWTPYAELYHHESATRGGEDSPEKAARFAREIAYMEQALPCTCDPAYSPNLTKFEEDFSLAWPPRIEILN